MVVACSDAPVERLWWREASQVDAQQTPTAQHGHHSPRALEPVNALSTTFTTLVKCATVLHSSIVSGLSWTLPRSSTELPRPLTRHRTCLYYVCRLAVKKSSAVDHDDCTVYTCAIFSLRVIVLEMTAKAALYDLVLAYATGSRTICLV